MAIHFAWVLHWLNFFQTKFCQGTYATPALTYSHVCSWTHNMSSTPDASIILLHGRYFTILYLHFSVFKMQMFTQLLCETFWDSLMKTPGNKQYCQLTKVSFWPIPCMHRWLTIMCGQYHSPPAMLLHSLRQDLPASSWCTVFELYSQSSCNVCKLQVSRAIEKQFHFARL